MAAGWDSTLDDIDRLRRELERSERAEIEDRVTDRSGYLAAMERRRQRLRELEHRAGTAGHELALLGIPGLLIAGNARRRTTTRRRPAAFSGQRHG